MRRAKIDSTGFWLQLGVVLIWSWLIPNVSPVKATLLD